MSAYTEFFLSSDREVAQLQLIEISHPDFSQTYRKSRNSRAPITVTEEDNTEHEYTYLPMRITQLGTRDDLDTGIRVMMGDLGEILPQELDNVYNADGHAVRPTVKYRVYKSNDLTAPLYGPLRLQIKTLAFAREGVSFDAISPQLNNGKTGAIYSYLRFPMLRGFV